MADVHSIRDFHNRLDGVCSSLEAIFQLAGDDFEQIETAARPAMEQFRALLELGDKIIKHD